MSSGKEAARDKRYGRRAGRWASEQRIDVALAEIHTLRVAAVKRGEWPDHARAEWSALADQAREHRAAGRTMELKLERALETVEAAGWGDG